MPATRIFTAGWERAWGVVTWAGTQAGPGWDYQLREQNRGPRCTGLYSLLQNPSWPINWTWEMAPPLDEIHPLTSQWPPGISVMPLSKEFLNTFQVIQLSFQPFQTKTDLWKRGNSHGRREDTHTLPEQRWVSFYFSAVSKGELYVLPRGEWGWRFLLAL